MTVLDFLQDTEGCLCEGRWAQRWTHGPSLIAHVMSNAIFVTANVQQVQEHSSIYML